MAVYAVPDGGIAVHNKTLAAGVVDAVNFPRDPRVVEVLTDGAAAVYVTSDGTNPTVGGAHTYLLPAVSCARAIPHGGNMVAVRLISSGTPTYSVTVLM